MSLSTLFLCCEEKLRENSAEFFNNHNGQTGHRTRHLHFISYTRTSHTITEDI